MKMKVFLLSLIFLITGALTAYSQSVLDYVDLFICTAGDHGQLDPSATVPFGMIKPGPDTNPGNHSGYDYNADKITGFSQNRIGGVGCNGAGGNLRILPFIGFAKEEGAGYFKETEKAVPGYYSVLLEDQIQAELTATSQTAIHRYTYPASDSSFVEIDTGSSFSKLLKTSSEMINEHEFYVSVTAKNVCNNGRYTVYYHVWCNKNLKLTEKKGKKLYFMFRTENKEEILFYVTISGISAEAARKQWQQESEYLTFDEVREAASGEWNNLLSRILVEGKEEYKTLFYTHLYHMFLNPVKSGNSQGQFRAENGKIYQSEGYKHYDTWSVWDNFRNKFSLYSLIMPETATDIAKSLTDLYRYGKPWKYGKKSAVPTVRAEHAGILLLDFYERGIRDFDVESVFENLKKELKKSKAGSPDKKLEISYDYWALARFAEILGKNQEAEEYFEKAASYKTIWQKRFLPISEKSDVMHGDGLYEGTLWQYRWNVPFDLKGIIEMIGGREELTSQLEYFFENNLYSHGNEPDIHVPYLFNYGTKPWLTQKWVNRILTKDMIQNYGTHEKWEDPYVGKIYKAEPEGFIPEMDDDDGTMSAWYVLSSMGFYPVEIGTSRFQITSPIFDRVTINLENGKTFEIVTENQSDSNFYIQSITLNNEPLNKPQINYEDILKGGKLVFMLSDEPNTILFMDNN